MTKLPNAVYIGPYSYSVEIVDRPDPTDTGTVGMVQFDTERILISRAETPVGRWDTLIHEALHAISRLMPEDLHLNEARITAISPYLTAFLISTGVLEPERLTPEQDAERLELSRQLREERPRYVAVDGC